MRQQSKKDVDRSSILIEGLPRCEIVSTTGWNVNFKWKDCRFYLSPGEKLLVTMDRAKTKMVFTDCRTKKLGDACSTKNLAAKARATASSEDGGSKAANARDGKPATVWKAKSATDEWLQLDFGKPTTINEFKIKEGPSSAIIRYVIECWDDKARRWVSCFNGRSIGPDFMAPIVSRTTSKARLFVMKTTKGNPCISEFEAYNDTTGTKMATNPGAPVAAKKEKPFKPRPGVIHIEAETLTGGQGIGVKNCADGGQQVDVGKGKNALKYEFDVPAEGVYVVTLHTAAGGGNQMDISAGGAGKWEKGSIKVPNTSGAWATTKGVEIELAKGRKTLWMSSPRGGFALRWIELKLK